MALSIAISDRHFGVGGDGLVLICPSAAADAKMRMFNADGSEGKMCGNAIRCVGKYLYDSGMVHKPDRDHRDPQRHQDPGAVRERRPGGLRSGEHGPRHPDPRGHPGEPPRGPGGGRSCGHRREALGDHLRFHGQPPLRGLRRGSRRPGPPGHRPPVRE